MPPRTRHSVPGLSEGPPRAILRFSEPIPPPIVDAKRVELRPLFPDFTFLGDFSGDFLARFIGNPVNSQD